MPNLRPLGSSFRPVSLPPSSPPVPMAFNAAAAPSTFHLRPPSPFFLRPPSSSLLLRLASCFLPPTSQSPQSRTLSTSLPLRRRPPSTTAAASRNSDQPLPVAQSSRFQEWDTMTARFAGASNVPFLLIQLPQIILNARNLGVNKAALLAVPWLGMLTGLLGNLTLLSYFVKKNENEAVLVQTLGVVSIYVVLAQLAVAEAMPLLPFTAASVAVASGLVVNFLKYFRWLPDGVWRVWEDVITVGGLSVLPQVMWSTFVPFIPNSILPGTVSFVLALVLIVMARSGKLSEEGVKFVGNISGWTATLLFMWMPIAQMWTNYLHPDNIKGLSSLTMLLGMIGNGLMIPRALFIRDLMWFTGSSWASLLHGWGNLICMYSFNAINREFFFAATACLFLWIGNAVWQDMRVYGHTSPLQSLKELVSGT